MVTRLIDNTNCTIQDDSGKTKNVHLNQLKPIVRRDIQGTYPLITHDVRPYILFDDLHDDQLNVDNIQNVENSDVNSVIHNDVEQHEPVINNGWCNIDESNILPHRTRNSGGVHGDAGSIAAVFIN